MDTIDAYIQQLPPERQGTMRAVHQLILENDVTVNARIGDMMGKTMILYEDRGSFKYGLASVKEYMSLHVLPIYSNPQLHKRYLNLLPDAKMQKGCINFKDQFAFPPEIALRLITDCAKIDMLAERQKYLDQKKKKKP